MQKNMVAFKNFVSSFRTVARTPPALIVERGVTRPMTMERFYNELKYLLSVGVALAGAAVVVNQEMTKTKLNGVEMEVAQIGQRVDQLGQRMDQLEKKVDDRFERMEKKFERMEKKLDNVLSHKSRKVKHPDTSAE